MKNLKNTIAKIVVAAFFMSSVMLPYSTAFAASGSSPKVNKEKSQIIVKYKDDSKADSVKEKVKKKQKLSKIDTKKKNKRTKAELLEIGSSDDVNKVVTELKKDPNVQYAQPNYKLTPTSTPSDERFNEQWGLLNDGQSIGYVPGTPGVDINATAAWESGEGSPSVVIGVLDTGIDISHEDLKDNIYVNSKEIPGNGIDDDSNGYIDDVKGYDFYNGDGSVFDSDSSEEHGTHVAGIIGASANNKGIKGVAPNVKILPLKFIDNGTGYTSDAIDAIEYAKSLGVKVINCSFGSTDDNQALKDEMASSGILFVCAAGNSNSDTSIAPMYPAAFALSNVISVTAVDNNGSLAGFANYGKTVDLAAPGVGILSTLPGNQYGLRSGTSQAAPFVTGTAALVQSQYPDLTVLQIRSRLTAGVQKLDKLDGKVFTRGLINAGSSISGTLDTSKEETNNKEDKDGKSGDSKVTTLAAEVSQQLLEQIHYGETGINVATGNFSETFTDMSVTAPGFTVNFSRTYNSRDTRTTSTMGKGWFFGFEGSFKVDTTNSTQWIATLPNGAANVFVRSGDTFTANDSRSTMVLSGDTYILTTKDQYTYGFNTSNGYLKWMKDKNGNAVTINVDSAGKVQTVTDTVGRTFTVGYNGSGYITSITDPMSRKVIYAYDSSNRLVSVTDPNGNAIANYTYDASSGCLGTIQDKYKNSLETLTYTGSTNAYKVSTYKDANGNTQTYSYDTASKVTTLTDTNGYVIKKWYDNQYFVIKTQDPEGKIASVTYFTDTNGVNKFGEEQSITDRYGNTTKYDRDSNGNITKITNPDNSTRSYTYDSKNNLTSETDELGHVTYYIYDANKINLLKKVQPLNGTDAYSSDATASRFAITTYVYYSDAETSCKVKGLLKSVTDPEDNTITYTYDQYGNKTSEKDAEDNTTSYTYNTIGWLQTATSPEGFKTTYSYDNDGRLVSTKLDKGETTRTVYGAMGRKLQEITPNLYDPTKDGLNSQTPSQTYSDTGVGYRFAYNAAGKVLTQTDAAGNTTGYIYDLYGNVKTEIKPNSSIYEYAYDKMNRLTKVTFKKDSTDTGTVTKEYGYGVGNKCPTKTETIHLNSKEDSITVYTYDYRGNEISRKNPDGATITTEYYANGLAKSLTDGNGGTSYLRYDGLNRPVEKWTPVSVGKYSYSATAYDKAGRKTAEKIGKDTVELYSVPVDDRLIKTSYTYYGNGKVKVKTDSNGRKTAYQYDKDGNLNRQDVYLSSSSVQVTEYENNQRGKTTSKIVHVDSTDIFGSGDNAGETLIATKYDYDLDGNLKTTTAADGTVTSMTYDSMDRVKTTKQMSTDEKGMPKDAVAETTNYSWDGQPLKTKDALGTITDYEYDKRGLLLSVTKTDSKGEKYTTAYAYDIAGRKTIEVSPLNYVAGTELGSLSRTEYVYDRMGRVIAQKDIYKKNPEDASFTTIVSKAYKYDFNSNVIKELDGRGYEAGTGSDDFAKINSGYGTEYTYDLSNHKLTVRDAVSEEKGLTFTVKYAYDGAGRKTSETDANGAILNYIYDDAGNILRVTSQKTISSPALMLKECRYDLIGNVIEETDGNRNTTAYEYNLIGKVRKTFYPSDSSIEGYVVTCKYDVMGNLAQKQDSMGVIDLFTYDRQGRQLTHTQQSSDGKDTISTSAAYDLNGNKRFETDANGTTTENIYDSLNRLITTKVSVRNAGGTPVLHTTTFGYDKNSNQTTTTDWLGNITTNTYDALNRVVEKADPYGTIQKLEYNSSHLQVKSYEAKDKKEDGSLNFVATTFTYDKNNRLVSTTDPEGDTTSQTYDKAGNISTKTDGNGNVTTYDYNELKHLASVTNAKGEKTSFTYDLNGNMISQTDGRSNTSLFEYNSGNKIVRKIDAGGRKGNAGSYTYTASKTEVYNYYADGSLKSKTDRNNVVTYYEYDIHGRMLKEKAKDTTVEYTYDSNGNQLTMKDGTGTTTRTYDELGRVVTKTVGNLGTSTFQYDITKDVELGQYAEISKDLKGNETQKIFDKVGRLAEVRDGQQTTGTKYEYNPNGSTKSVTYPDGSHEEYTYRDDHLLDTLKNYNKTILMDTYTYTYDDAHNQLTKSEVINGTDYGTTNYVYDSLNRLAKVTEPGGKTTEYTYDKAGNRETETVAAGTQRTLTTYTYNEQNRLMSTVQQLGDVRTTTKYGYDNNGNLTSKLTSQIKKIDPLKPPEAHFGMFIAGQEKDGATQYAKDIAGFAQYFEYDVFNQMIKSSTGTSSGEYTYYGDGQRATATTNGKTTRFIYEASQVTLELDSKGNQSARNIYGNNLITRNTGGQSVYYMYNGHADVTALLKTDGTVMAAYRYDAFGNALDDTTKANLKNIENPYTYGGYRFDDESGLYYLNARYYDPATARFMSEDTYSGDLSDPLSLNLYTYCSNNPIIYWDPTGHWQQGDEDYSQDVRIALSRLTDVYCSTNDPAVKERCAEEAAAIRQNNKKDYSGNSSVAQKFYEELNKDGSVSANDWKNISNTINASVSPGAIDTVNGAQNMVDEYYKQKQIDKAFNSVYDDLNVNRSKSTNNVSNSDMGSAASKGISSGIPKVPSNTEGLTIGVVDPITKAGNSEAQKLLDSILDEYHPYEWPDSYRIKQYTMSAFYDDKYDYEVNRSNDIASFFNVLDIGTTIKTMYDQALKSSGGFLPVTIVGTIVFTAIDKAWKKEPGVGDLPKVLGINSSLTKSISRALEKSEFVDNSIYKYLVYRGPFLFEEGPRGEFIDSISELETTVAKRTETRYSNPEANATYKKAVLKYLEAIKNMNINYEQSLSDLNYCLDKIDDKY